jgi:Ca-activated chloride channel family protein
VIGPGTATKGLIGVQGLAIVGPMAGVWARRVRAAIAALALSGGAAPACETALLLAVDVSNSIDAGEYRIQTRGMAAALRDGVVVEAMVRGANAIAVMQWSGTGMQEMTIPWRRIASPADMEALAAEVEEMRRAYIGANTAIGEAVRAGTAELETQTDCARLILDVSGDGPDNAGTRIDEARWHATRAGITVNGLAIDGLGAATTTYYERRLITPDGFVETARGFTDFPRAIRVKIRREVSRIMG